jgi:hypothetical protein
LKPLALKKKKKSILGALGVFTFRKPAARGPSLLSFEVLRKVWGEGEEGFKKLLLFPSSSHYLGH